MPRDILKFSQASGSDCWERIYAMMRFDRFTERAQEAAQRAAEIIQRYGHNQIDTEHILLALIEQPGGVIPKSLRR